nr:Na+/H+ antiporter subunit C [Kallotenue papyrolyticum]
MTVVLALVIGGLYAVGIYLLLQRNLARVIIGLALLTNAANLLIFTVGGLVRARPPLVPTDASRPATPIADPLPQALILTAIVIGFGVLAFFMVLAYRASQAVGSDDLNAMQSTDYLVGLHEPYLTETYDEQREADVDGQVVAPPAEAVASATVDERRGGAA